MSTRLNLASKPFRNRVLPWTVTALVAISSIAALLYIAQSTFKMYGSISGTQKDVTQLRTELDSLLRKQKAVEIALTADQKRELKYAHGLVDRKGFSWSRLFTDLEASLPGEIRVTKIAVKGVGVQDGRPAAELPGPVREWRCGFRQPSCSSPGDFRIGCARPNPNAVRRCEAGPRFADRRRMIRSRCG